LSEFGYAIFKACTRPAPDAHRPLGGAKTYLRESQGPVAQMSSSGAEALPKAASNAMPVGSVGQWYASEHRARMDMLMGPGADYDMDEINALASASAGTTNKAEFAKEDLISTWKSGHKEGRLTINHWQPEVPIQFARDFIVRGEVGVVNGQLVAAIKDNKNTHEHQMAKMGLVDRVVNMMLDDARTDPSAQVTDTEKVAFKQNLFSFTQQGNCAMFLVIVAEATKLVPMQPTDLLIDFSFSATDGKNVVIEQRYETESFPVTDRNMNVSSAGSLRSKIVFSVPIEQLKRTDFDPSCLTVVSADWQLAG